MSDPVIREKILTFLSENYPIDFNIQEIADKIGIHRNTVSLYLKVLVAEKEILISRNYGKINMYMSKQD